MFGRFFSLVLILLCCSNFFFTSGLKKKLAVKNKTRQLDFPVDTYVYIKSLNKGLCLTSTNKFTLEKCTNSENQLWKAAENSDDKTFIFYSKSTGLVWDVGSRSTGNGSEVINFSVNFGGNQRWFIEKFKTEGYYMFKGKSSDRCLDTRGEPDLEGKSPVIYDCSDDNINQAWSFEKP